MAIYINICIYLYVCVLLTFLAYQLSDSALNVSVVLLF